VLLAASPGLVIAALVVLGMSRRRAVEAPPASTPSR